MSQIDDDHILPTTAERLARMVHAAGIANGMHGTHLHRVGSRLAADADVADPERDAERGIGVEGFVALLQRALDDVREDGEGMRPELAAATQEGWSVLATVIAAARPRGIPAVRRELSTLGGSLLRELTAGRPTQADARAEAWSILASIGHPYTVEQLESGGIEDMWAAAPWQTVLNLGATADLDNDVRLHVLSRLARTGDGGVTPELLADAFVHLYPRVDDPQQAVIFTRPRFDRFVASTVERHGNRVRDLLRRSLPSIVPEIVGDDVRRLRDPTLGHFASEALER